MRFKISTLVIGIAATIAGVGQAEARGTYGNYFDSVEIFTKNIFHDMNSTGFLSDSKMNLEYIQDYRVKDDQGSSLKDDGYEDWVQGERFDFVSGWIGNVLGFNYSYDSVFDINSDHKRGMANNESSGNLPIRGGSINHKNYNNISGTSQAYLKARFGDIEDAQDMRHSDSIAAYITGGKMVRHRKQYGDSTSRVGRAASTGGDVDINLYGTHVYATYINGFSPRNQSYFSKDLKAGGKAVDYVIISGLEKQFSNGASIAYEHAETQDYVKKDFVKLAYGSDGFHIYKPSEQFAWGADVRYGTSNSNGKNFTVAPGESKESNYYNVNAQVSYANAYAAVGYNKVNKGLYNEYSFDGDTGTFNSSLSREADYRLEDERAYVADVGYNFAHAGLPGLTYHTWYVGASHAKGMDGSRHEWGNGLKYNFSGDAKITKGASIEWYNANYDGYNNHVPADKPADSYNLNKVIFRYNYPFSF